MPSPKWMISSEETRFFLKMIPDDEFSPMLRKSFQNEAQHNTIDTVLLQDMQHCCDENHLASIIGLNSMFYNASPLQEKRCPKEVMTILNTILRNRLALAYLMEYFETQPVEV